MSVTTRCDDRPRVHAVAWRGERISRIILGTVQLGMDYGIANTQGRPDLRTAAAIVETAWEHGIRCFDTAQAYGDSEAVLGRVMRDMGVLDEARVASKLNPVLDPADVSQVASAIEQTFDRLGTDRLWLMMLHRAAFLDHWDHGLGELMCEHRDAGRFQHLGVSLASPDEAARCVAHPDIEVLQVACNAWDRRMIRLGVFETARRTGRLCCVRSIYLQGLLTLSAEAAAERLPQAADAAQRWHVLASRYGMPPLEMAMRFALTLDAPLVVGAESPDQVRGTVGLACMDPLPREIIDALSETLDPVLVDTVLDPRFWHAENGD